MTRLDNIAKQPAILWGPSMALYLSAAGDSISNAIIGPFLPTMLMENFHVDPARVGFWTGAFASLERAALCISSLYILQVSAKIGRLNTLLFGLLSSAAIIVIFPFSSNVYFALAIRTLRNLLSSAETIIRATLNDITIPVNRSRMFGYMGAVWAISRALSSFASAIMTKNKKKGKDDGEYLYACILAAVVLVIASIFAFIKLRRVPSSGTAASQMKKQNQEELGKSDAMSEKTAFSPPASINEPPKHNAFINYFIMSGKVLRPKGMKSLFTLMFLGHIGNGAFWSILTLFQGLPVNHHGLGFDSFQIGMSLGQLGVCGFVFQVCIAKHALRLLGSSRRIWSFLGCVPFAIGMAIYAFLGIYDVGSEVNRWAVMIVGNIFLGIGYTLLLPAGVTMMTNATTDKSLHNHTQGLNQSTNFVARSIGPLFACWIYDKSREGDMKKPWIIFAMFACMYVAIGIWALLLPNDVEVRPEDKMEEIKSAPDMKEFTPKK